LEGLDALMIALGTWNGGVIVISHDERFITSVAKEVRECCCLSCATLTPLCHIALGVWRWYNHKVQRRCGSL
jgi:hypothetical protein